MLFFQVGLLLGYAYAHLLSNTLSPKRQAYVHVPLLLLSLFLLPITPGDHLKPTDGSSPELGVILLLLSTVGIPYMIVSSTGPLLQHWFSRSYPDRSPYRLYSLSNVGSLLGLITYPFIVEPNMGVGSQTILWSVGYACFVLVCTASAVLVARIATKEPEPLPTQPKEPQRAYTLGNLCLWLLLSASGSVLLLSATNFVCQNVAVIPFLWVLPLSLYLISFIICFDNSHWYKRRIWLSAFILIVPVIFIFLNNHYNLDLAGIGTQIAVYIGGMFIACMVCHGELVRLKPPSQHLTLFYLTISFGGALGGVFVTFIAPQIFSDYWEFPLIFILTLTVAAWLVLFKDKRLKIFRIPLTSAMVAVLLVLGMFMNSFQARFHEGVLATTRNFYGVMRVIESGSNDSRPPHIKMYHGGINHGLQAIDPDREFYPSSYYAAHSGVGLAIRRHPIRTRQRDGSTEGFHIGIVGLGAGALSAYQGENDRYRYYELDPDVEMLARDHFSYLERGGDNTEVIIGDARISLERELRESGSQKFDILVVDAFSGDAIPIHLLTLEAFDLYRQHLKPDGIIAIHISNKFFDLQPLIYGTAKEIEMEPLVVLRDRDSSRLIKRSRWTLLSNNAEFLIHPRVLAYIDEWPEDIEERQQVWTDDFANVLDLLD